MNEAPQAPAGVDTGRPTPARIYDYMLQGSNYFQVDRFAAEQILKAAPEIRDAAWSNRGFHQRAAKEGAEPGVTFTGLWGAEDIPMADSDGSRWLYCGVARKP
ncbi:MAG TPA: SAM-dependent methyltransferase [Streptosporangiaceae bacterium]|jgi:hypothetical protein